MAVIGDHYEDTDLMGLSLSLTHSDSVVKKEARERESLANQIQLRREEGKGRESITTDSTNQANQWMRQG